MLFATAILTIVLLLFSVVETRRWLEARRESIGRDDVYYLPTVLVTPILVMLGAASSVLLWVAAAYGSNTSFSWVNYVTPVLCAGICLIGAMDARRTCMLIADHELTVLGLGRRRSVPIKDIEKVRMVSGNIVLRLRSGKVMLASNTLGWNTSLRMRLDELIGFQDRSRQ